MLQSSSFLFEENVVKVKICGITNIEDAFACVNFGADAIGFVFAESPRKIDKVLCRDIIEQLPPFITVVGLFANQQGEEVEEISSFCSLDVLQFHGDESPKFCGIFKKRVIKAFRIKNREDLGAISKYNVSACLFDSYVKERAGGTGKSFDWKILSGIKGKRFIVAGGLNPENVEEAIKECKPYGVDVSSGVEKSPGIKDHKKIEKFIKAVRKEE